MKPMTMTKPNVEIIRPVARQKEILRIAPYCRVSSSSEDQLHSYAAQIDYYTKLVGANPEWELVDIYADEGLSGTRMEKRDDLDRLITDCKKGKIDKVLIKAFHRLARNTTDCLTIIRDLKLMGVSVRSERERLDTADLSGEMLIMLWADMAQEESNSISQNMRWSYKKRMRRGEFITCKAPYGYELIDGKMLAPKYDETHIIRWIFDNYLKGISPEEMAEQLDAKGINTPESSQKWRPAAIRYILTNEKYAGDTIAQKKMSTDAFPFQKKPNKGEKDKYYIRNSHPAIIRRDVFQKAQMLMSARGPRPGWTPNKYPLSGKLFCSACGAALKRRQSKNGRVAWVCRRHDQNSSDCDTQRIAETAVYTAFTKMAIKLKQHADHVLEPALCQVQDLQTALRRDHAEIISLRQQLADTAEQAHTLSKLRRQNMLDDATWQSYSNENNMRRYELRRKLRILLDHDSLNEIIEDLAWLTEVLRDTEVSENIFPQELFEEIVQRAEISADGSIRFLLPGEIVITERLEGGLE